MIKNSQIVFLDCNVRKNEQYLKDSSFKNLFSCLATVNSSTCLINCLDATAKHIHSKSHQLQTLHPLLSG